MSYSRLFGLIQVYTVVAFVFEGLFGIVTNKKAKSQVIINCLFVNQLCVTLVLGISHKQRM